MPLRIVLLSFFLTLCVAGNSQRELITFSKLNRQVELPFTYVNDFIVVELVVNQIFSLRFIFDTGAENTIITRKEYLDILNVNYKRQISIYGADLKTELTAYIAPGIDFQIADHLQVWSQAILVLEEDYFRFEEYTGSEIHGILGADMLRRFTVSIDFRRKRIILEDPQFFEGPRRDGFFEVDCEFERYKPYFTLPAKLLPGQPTKFKLLMDTGASLPLLLYTNADTSLVLPENLIQTNIGYGLGGTIEGFLGRTEELDIGAYKLGGVLTRFQDISETYDLDSTFINNRNGLVGNVILNRFTIIVDYPRERVYLRPNRNLRDEFTYDRSGLSLIASGENLNKINVLNVVENSPAYEAGIRKGDVIKKVNGVSVSLIGLAGFVRRFRKRSGKVMKVVYRRDGKRYKVRFTLRDLI